MRAHVPSFSILFAVVTNVAFTRFKVNKDFVDALVHLRTKNIGRGTGRGGATAGEQVHATSLWGIL